MNKKKKIYVFIVVTFIVALCIYAREEIMFEFALNRADYYSENGEYVKAIAEYDRLLALEPETYELLFNKAVILGESGDIEAACNVFMEAEKLNDKDAELYYNLAHLYDGIDDNLYQMYMEKGMMIEFEKGIQENNAKE